MQKKIGSFIVKAGCMIVIVLPITIFCLFTLAYSSYTLFCVLQAQSWTPTEAQLINTDVGHSYDGDESRVLVEYKYDFKGQHYSNDQLSFDSRTDNVGLHYQILSHLNSALAIEVYVNPKKPSQAVIIKGFLIKIISVLSTL